jgi:cytochrome c oxidase cbb3-type subunit 3
MTRRIWMVLLGVLLLVGGVTGALALRARQRDAALLRADPDALSPTLRVGAAAAGARIFARDCAACHGAQARGDRSMGVPDLTDRDWLYGTGRVSEIAQTVRHGIRSGDPHARNLSDMPAFAQPVPYAREKLPSLRPAQVSDLVAYLLMRESRPADSAAAERGAALFRTAAGCWDCHGEDARGDNAVGAPNLADAITLYGDGGAADLFHSIAGGHQGICPAWFERLSAAEIVSVAVFVQTRSGAPR